MFEWGIMFAMRRPMWTECNRDVVLVYKFIRPRQRLSPREMVAAMYYSGSSMSIINSTNKESGLVGGEEEAMSCRDGMMPVAR